MEYKVYGNRVFARLDRGEEIMEQLEIICDREHIRFAEVSAIGALGSFNIGIRLFEAKEYKNKDFVGDYELISISGNITQLDGKFYPHLHICVADTEGNAFGGHLNWGRISVTCEICLHTEDAHVYRTHDEETGLNLMRVH